MACCPGYSGPAAPISYSTPGRVSADYGSGYAGDSTAMAGSAQRDGFAQLASAQLAAVRGALDCDGGGLAGRRGSRSRGSPTLSVSSVGGRGGAGDIRVANCADAPTAYAYYPGGGDAAATSGFGGAGATPRAGNYDGLTVLHEVGHALGLKHSHEKAAASARCRRPGTRWSTP